MKYLFEEAQILLSENKYLAIRKADFHYATGGIVIPAGEIFSISYDDDYVVIERIEGPKDRSGRLEIMYVPKDLFDDVVSKGTVISIA